MDQLNRLRNEEKKRVFVESNSQAVTGKNIDEMCTYKEMNLKQLYQELKDLKRECEQLKTLNIKLVERTEKL